MATVIMVNKHGANNNTKQNVTSQDEPELCCSIWFWTVSINNI